MGRRVRRACLCLRSVFVSVGMCVHVGVWGFVFTGVSVSVCPQVCVWVDYCELCVDGGASACL